VFGTDHWSLHCYTTTRTECLVLITGHCTAILLLGQSVWY